MSSTAHLGPERGRVQAVATRVHGKPPAPRLDYQGLVTRAIAFTIDAAVINVVAVVVAAAAALIVSALSLPESLDVALIAAGAWLFVIWSALYFVTFWSSTGETPGNRVMRIRVVRARDGAALGPRRSLLRLVALMLAALPLFAGFLTILVDGRRRGLHDMLASTVVVGVAGSVDEHLERHEQQAERAAGHAGER